MALPWDRHGAAQRSSGRQARARGKQPHRAALERENAVADSEEPGNRPDFSRASCVRMDARRVKTVPGAIPESPAGWAHCAAGDGLAPGLGR